MRIGDALETFIFIPGDPGRLDVEHFIRRVYWEEYGATLSQFPPVLLAARTRHGAIAAAAGIRTQADGFFSEAYLGEPVEARLSSCSGSAVPRSAIFEVANLVSADPRMTARFIDAIVRYGIVQGFHWSFFTLTRRLRSLLDRLGLDVAFLAEADRQHVSNPQSWGSYYAADPCVFAIRNPTLTEDVPAGNKEDCRANAA
jgi:hypothetical protein